MHRETPANISGERIDGANRAGRAELVILLWIASGEWISRYRRLGFARVERAAFPDRNVKQSCGGIVRRRGPIRAASGIRTDVCAFGSRVGVRQNDRPALRIEAPRPGLARKSFTEQKLAVLAIEHLEECIA